MAFLNLFSRSILPPRQAKIATVILLCLINLVNYMDRLTVSGVLTQIEDEFDISHAQGGLLQTAFVICYFMSAPLFGFLGDRYSRKTLILVGVVLWGACTAISSFMMDYVGFLLLRSAIGFGEAGFTTVAPTLLSDLYDGSARSIVFAMFYYAIPVGSGLGYIVGSKIAELTGNWRWGVRFTPFLNIVFLILMFLLMVDPPRGEKEISSQEGEDKNLISQLRLWKKDLSYLIRNKSYVLSTLAFTSLTFATGALSWWGPAFMEYALDYRADLGLPIEIAKTDVAFIFGVVMVVAGVAGLSFGSGLSYFLRKNVAWIDPVICGGGLLVAAPFVFSALAQAASLPTVGIFVLMCIGQIFLNMNWAVIVDISMYVVIPSRRASANAFQLMASHALGEAGSPYICGLIADAVKSNLNETVTSGLSSMNASEINFTSLQISLYSSMGFELLSGIFFLITTIFVVADRLKAANDEKCLTVHHDEK